MLYYQENQSFDKKYTLTPDILLLISYVSIKKQGSLLKRFLDAAYLFIKLLSIKPITQYPVS